MKHIYRNVNIHIYTHDLIIGSSSMTMGTNSHEDHCHDYKDCEIWCKQFVPAT